MDITNLPWLTIIILFPIVAALFIPLIPDKDGKTVRWYALIVGLINFVFLVYAFYTNYDLSNHAISDGGQVQLMSSYISRLITSSVNQSVDEFPALEVNSKLEQIQDTIKNNLSEALIKNGLEGKITIDSIIVGKADLPDDLVASVNRVVAAQSANKEQEVRTKTAQLKAEENKALASTVTNQSLEYQRNEILKAAFENGSIQKMVIINGASMDFLPGGFTGK